MNISSRAVSQGAVPNPTAAPEATDPLHATILRLIHNSRQEHAACALARGRYGLHDYGQLGNLLPHVSLPRLSEYLGEIGEIRFSHRRCRL